jgi:hypothetical protein
MEPAGTIRGRGSSTNQVRADSGSTEKLCLQSPAHGNRIFGNTRHAAGENFGSEKWEPVKSQVNRNLEDCRIFVCT